MAAGVVHIPWYATFFRGDRLAEALAEIAPLALRYGATSYTVERSRDDQYKFLHRVTMPDKLAWERYFNGPEFIAWREEHSSWFQVPVLYVWHDVVTAGEADLDALAHHAGDPDPAPEPSPEAA